ncbi:MAG: phosphate ABC transporter permease subunit PstC [Xanthomonadaceae bacterium]|nr:phosphate ABC transporter permease subunit PstC [Xanthomonadaceae bacterium]
MKHRQDILFKNSLGLLSWAFIAVLVAMILSLLHMSGLAWEKIGFSFFTTSHWNPVKHQYGVAAFAWATLVTSLLALLISTPLSLAVAVSVTELMKKRAGRVFGFFVDMLAAIPSVVYGLWGIFVLVPLMRTQVQPWLFENLGWIGIFSEVPYGVGILTASIVLAIMILPTMSSLLREVFQTIPLTQKEAALGLGATKTEMIYLSVVKSSKSSIVAAMVLGLARALGETMAVTMVIGNRNDWMKSIFSPAQTMASLIANEYVEATHDLHLSALALVGVTLLMISSVIQLVFRAIYARGRK